MKNKHKSIKDIDFAEELTGSELEQVNGGGSTIRDLKATPPPPPGVSMMAMPWPGKD